MDPVINNSLFFNLFYSLNRDNPKYQMSFFYGLKKSFNIKIRHVYKLFFVFHNKLQDKYIIIEHCQHSAKWYDVRHFNALKTQ